MTIVGVALVLGLLVAPLATQEQPAERTPPRIGALGSDYAEGPAWTASVPRPEDLEPALRALTRERPDALFVHPVPGALAGRQGR